MVQRFRGATLILAICSGFAAGQSTPTPSFEVVDIHPSARTTNPYMRGGAVRGGRYEVKTASLLELISFAYETPGEQIQGGPPWLDSTRFDIVAKAAPGTTQATLNLMLQALLAERFKLAVHKDSKPLPAYSLTVGKGRPKMNESVGSAPSGCQGKPQEGPPADNPYSEVSCRNVTMVLFAQMLRGMTGGLLPNPIVDNTGLKGAWDFDLKWSSRRQLALSGADAISIFDAVDKQLGLKLDLQKISMPVIVIDGMNQAPTPNAPDVVSKLPSPPPAEFEVADVRPSAPGNTQQTGDFQNGRLNVRNFPLKQLIQAAWDINSEDLIAGVPKFAETARYDVVAKASIDPTIASQIDDDTLLLMLRGLLVERFKLATHTEERPISGYTLTASKPKLQKADPSNRTQCKEGPGADGKDPRITNPVLNRLMSCYNMTMAQFADQLPNLVSGYVRTQVVDNTGLEGAFDFTLSFSGVNILRAGGRGGDGASSDPNGALSLQDAISKQLGLKLELQKRNMPVLVIDHLEEKPTDN